MEYKPTVTTCPYWYKIHQGKCVNCYEPETMKQDWKEKIYHIITHNGTSECHLKLVVLVESLLKEERNAVLKENQLLIDNLRKNPESIDVTIDGKTVRYKKHE